MYGICDLRVFEDKVTANGKKTSSLQFPVLSRIKTLTLPSLSPLFAVVYCEGL